MGFNWKVTCFWQLEITELGKSDEWENPPFCRKAKKRQAPDGPASFSDIRTLKPPLLQSPQCCHE